MKAFLILLSLSSFSCAQNSIENSTAISLSDFYDSAHHWYDIHDEERIIEPLPKQKKYKEDEIRAIADNILLFQKNNGGWPKNYDMQAVLTEEQKLAVLNAKTETNTTFDNGATHSQIIYLAKVYSATGEEKYKEGCISGIEFILKAQYPNGGFPQFYPDTSGYRKYITFNDGAMIGVMNVLYNVVKGSADFRFADDSLKNRIKQAYTKGLDCILKCQIKENGQLNAWCQQHDNNNFMPRSARTFEPASISNMESAGIVKFLMKIKNPDQKIINSIQNAVKWFNNSKISGIRFETISAPKTDYQYHSTDEDRIVVKDPDAPPIWARFYELKTHRPLFCNRDGKPVYSLSEVERERRTGYAWYVYDPQEILDKYPDWQLKWVPGENVLAE
ncbi:MAG: pectate lyase [Ignavibacteria bacterium]